jgi:hypothetical protein
MGIAKIATVAGLIDIGIADIFPSMHMDSEIHADQANPLGWPTVCGEAHTGQAKHNQSRTIC